MSIHAFKFNVCTVLYLNILIWRICTSYGKSVYSASAEKQSQIVSSIEIVLFMPRKDGVIAIVI